MRRREFIALLGSGIVGGPWAARAQQPTMPVVGFLRITRAEESGHLVAAFRQGLREAGYPSDKVVSEFQINGLALLISTSCTMSTGLPP